MSPFIVIHNIDEEGREKGCPTGQNCNKCNLYRPLYSERQSGEIVQTFDCTWNNLALLASEQNERTKGVQQAVESSRNESVKRQDKFNQIFERGSTLAQLKIDKAIQDSQ